MNFLKFLSAKKETHQYNDNRKKRSERVEKPDRLNFFPTIFFLSIFRFLFPINIHHDCSRYFIISPSLSLTHSLSITCPLSQNCFQWDRHRPHFVSFIKYSANSQLPTLSTLKFHKNGTDGEKEEKFNKQFKVILAQKKKEGNKH